MNMESHIKPTAVRIQGKKYDGNREAAKKVRIKRIKRTFMKNCQIEEATFK